jgi:hypothetical protein
MTDYTPEPKRGPGRPSNAEVAARQAQPQPAAPEPTTRQAETTQRRRRREGLGMERNLKLHIPESLKDPGFEYRWVNDRPGRVRQMTTDDDWDVVDLSKLGGDPDPGKNTAEGTVMTRVGDKGTGERMTLLRKPKEFYQADRKERFDALRKLEDSMKRRPPQSQDGLSDRDNSYIPGGTNTIG